MSNKTETIRKILHTIAIAGAGICAGALIHQLII